MAGYEEIPGLEEIYLEDSWVLAVCESESTLSFDLEAVLTREHSRWESPRAGEVHCYRRMSLTFTDLLEVEWLDPGARPALDATGEEDWGHIDTFVFDGDRYELSGDWGHVRFRSAPPKALAS